MAFKKAEVSMHYNVDVNDNWIIDSHIPHIEWQTGGTVATRGHIIADDVPYER